MAKKSESTKEVTTTQPAGAVALPNYGDQYRGAGWDGVDQSDFQIPFLNQLQALSPQCVDGGDQEVKGARPGMFYNSVTGQLYPAEVNLVVALTKHSFVEWRPQASGGGFVAEHALDSEVVRKAKEAANGSLDLKTPANNELVETFAMFALLLDGPNGAAVDQVVISFSRTKIKRYKQVMTRLRTFKGSDRIPLFAHRLVMSATNEKNAAGQPYKNVQLQPAIDNDVAKSLLPGDSPILELGDALRKAVLGGTAKANFETANATAGSGKDEAADEVFA